MPAARAARNGGISPDTEWICMSDELLTREEDGILIALDEDPTIREYFENLNLNCKLAVSPCPLCPCIMPLTDTRNSCRGQSQAGEPQLLAH